MALSPKVACVGNECVSCGTCVPVCPRLAITIVNGITACVNEDLCVGCSKCAKVCPAAVIDMVKREVVK